MLRLKKLPYVCIDSGHYTSFVRRGLMWFRCDDATITETDEDTVQASQAYLLFYIKRRMEYQDDQQSTRTTN